jgi:hypothetical protein
VEPEEPQEELSIGAPETADGDYGKDTERTDHADNRLARLLQYRRHEKVCDEIGRMAEAADTADVLETLETSADAIGDPDSVRNTPRTGMAMGKHPEKLLAYGQQLDINQNRYKPLSQINGLPRNTGTV